MIAGVAAAVTDNPIAKMVAQILTMGEGGGGLDKLAGVARAAGVKTVGNVSLDTAVNNAHANLGTVKAVQSMRQNGFLGDTIYASGQQIAANGGGSVGEHNFIAETALMLKQNKNGAQNDLSQVLQKPVEASKAQKAEAANTGVKASTVTAKSAQDFSNMRVEVVKSNNSALAKLNRRHSGNMNNGNLLEKLGYKEPTAVAVAPSLVADINKVGAEAEANRQKEALEFQRKEEERLRLEAQLALNRRFAAPRNALVFAPKFEPAPPQ
jgi:hypothetical protein